jgi:hypothetical protein
MLIHTLLLFDTTMTTMSNRTTTCDVVGGFLECTATSCPGRSAQQERQQRLNDRITGERYISTWGGQQSGSVSDL